MIVLSADTFCVVQLVLGLELTLMLAVVDHLLRGEAGLRPWTLGVASVTAGCLVLALRGTFGDAIPSLFGTGLICLGPALTWLGARDFCGRSRGRWPIWVGLALVLAWLGIGRSMLPPSRVDELAIALSGALWSAAIVWTLLRYQPEGQRTGVRAAGGLFALHGAFQLARAFFPVPEEAGLLLGQARWSWWAVAVGSVCFSIAWTFAVVGLMSQRLATKLRDQARTDGLTGLLNRRAFSEEGAGDLELCRRRGRPCALLLADLDHLKRLNDTLGHGAGDDALRRFAQVASAVAGNGALVGRFGGEEFCVLLPGVSRTTACELAERLRKEYARPPAPDRPVASTVSIGWALAEGQGLELSRMIAQADEALYRAKAEGRDRACEAA